MPPKVLRIVNGEIKEVELPAEQPKRDENGSDDDDDDGPMAPEETIARRLAAATSSSTPTFDFSEPPLAVSWEDRSTSLAGLPGLALFGAHLSSRWLVALAAATAVLGLKGLALSFAVWVLYKLGFESEQARASSGPHRLGHHPHSGSLPAGALRAYLSAAGGARGGGGGGSDRGAGAATAGRGATVAAPSGGNKSSSVDDVRAATRKAWAAREAAVAAAAAEAKSKE